MTTWTKETPASTDFVEQSAIGFLLLETGFLLLQENGHGILLEPLLVWTKQTPTSASWSKESTH